MGCKKSPVLYLRCEFSHITYRFRWVFCQLETLRDCYPQALRRALDKLPETLDATYERTLLGIEKTKREYAYRLFQCLVVSIRPLRVEELAEVLAVLLDTGEDSEYHVDWRPEDAQQSVLSTCSSLITVVNVDGSSVVQFSHFSVKEFLMSSRLANAGEHLSRYHIITHPAHSIIARASLNVLLNLGDKVDRSTIENHPLAIYASRYWVDHAKFEGVSSSIHDLMERLFDSDKPYFAIWLWLYDLDRRWEGHMRTTRPMQPKATPLYYASLCGFRNLVEYLAKKHPEDVNAIGGGYDAPLHAACAKREVDTVRVLLEHGARKDILDNAGQSPLHNASRHGHLDLVEILLEDGMDVNLRNGDGVNPLIVASRRGNLEVARFLIERGADHVTCRDKRGWSALHSAARYGHLNIVRLLLNLGSDVQDRSLSNETPLIVASTGGHVEVSRFLINHQADVNSTADGGYTSLLAASQYGHVDVVQLLLDRGADVNCRNADLSIPLHVASASGHLGVAELLIKGGAEVDVRDDDRNTPLHLASQEGELEIARLLIKGGSRVNLQGYRGRTPLHRAARNGHLDVVKLLIDSGADIGVRDKDNKTAFDIALDYGERDVRDFLLVKHAEGNLGTQLGDSVRRPTLLEAESQNSPHATVTVEPAPSPGGDSSDDEQDTSLHSAVEKGRNGLVEKLLNCGADVNERDELLQTPLDVASKEGKFEIARTLINYGADVNCRDVIGWTPLHTAARSGHIDVARLLLENGAEVNATQRNYQTPLHIASLNGHLKVVQLLLERGANVQLRNSYGRTPSQEASTRGYQKIARSLSKYGA